MRDWIDRKEDEPFTDEDLLFAALTGLMAAYGGRPFFLFGRKNKLVIRASMRLIQKRIGYDKAMELLHSKAGDRFARYCRDLD